MNKTTKSIDRQQLALDLLEIVEQHHIPPDQAISILSTALLWSTMKCRNPSCFADSVAHIRLSLPEEYDGASSALAAWLNNINELIDS